MVCLKGVNFGPVFASSGAMNFAGQGWPYHEYYRHIPGFGFEGVTMITKTITLNRRYGNMPLDKNLQPIETRPECIYVDFLRGLALNAVGLSGPGVRVQLARNEWQRLERPFIISFSTVGETPEERNAEWREFLLLLKREIFSVRYGIELNISCPNTGHEQRVLIAEAKKKLRIAGEILPNVPLIIKVSVEESPLTVAEIVYDTPCDAVDISNTLKWGRLPDRIDWEKLFGTKVSPLERFGGGGMSGKYLLPLVDDWIVEARRIGIELDIIGGGGIMHKADIKRLQKAGANGVSFGTMYMLRPWRTQGAADYGNALFSRGER
ncbi:hypothetical protein HGA64_01675 [Candidatus Falkowbacteria bacterium]|nr:hypothetical protein [Candidatus Falkowbacteria bacterium]